MANKSVHQKYNSDALDYFGLAGSPRMGLLVNQMVEEVLVTQDVTTYERVYSLLSTPTETAETFINKKKAFILPRCSVSQDRIKASLKEHGIKVTNDYSQADLIIGHSEINTNYQNSQSIQSTYLMMKLWNYEAATDVSNSSGFGTTAQTFASLIHNSTLPIIIHEKITDEIRYGHFHISDSLYDNWVITGMAINLAYKIELKEVSVVDPETILHSSANKNVLTEELVNDLIRQISSYNTDDQALAAKIIPTIDYNKEYHLLWTLAQNASALTYNFNRDKDVQYWLKKSNFFRFSNFKAEKMIQWLEKNNKLDKISFRYLEPIVRKEVEIYNRDLYVFTVTVKKEYLKYLKN